MVWTCDGVDLWWCGPVMVWTCDGVDLWSCDHVYMNSKRNNKLGSHTFSSCHSWCLLSSFYLTFFPSLPSPFCFDIDRWKKCERTLALSWHRLHILPLCPLEELLLPCLAPTVSLQRITFTQSQSSPLLLICRFRLDYKFIHIEVPVHAL